MTRPTARVLALLEILQGGGTRTVADLAGRLGVDERTVRRYVDHLIDLDVPVRSVRGRYGGYRLAPGYRMPPLMLTDEEALAVLLGLVAGRRAGLVTTSAAATESAAAKVRRVLPEKLGRRLDALLATAEFTAPARPVPRPETDVLLTLAEAARRRQPVAVSYTGWDGHHSQRTLHPYGIVVHSGRWYVTAADSASEQVRTFRLDRIEDRDRTAGARSRCRPGSTRPPRCCPRWPGCRASTRCRCGSGPGRADPDPAPGQHRRRRRHPGRTSFRRSWRSDADRPADQDAAATGRAGCGSGCRPSGWTGSRPCWPAWTGRS